MTERLFQIEFASASCKQNSMLRIDCGLTLTQYGILNERLFGAVAAVTTIWLSTVGLVPPGSQTVMVADAQAPENVQNPEGERKGPVKKPNLLTYSVIAGALVSGWFGAPMRTFRLNTELLQGDLAVAAESEK